MSNEEAKRFISDLKNDTGMHEAANNLSSEEEILNFAKGNGYDFSCDELQEECEAIELSDDEIENIAGGKKEFFASSEQVGGFLSF